MKNKYKNLFKNVGVFAISSFATRFVSFFVLPLYTYYLTTEEYGTIDLVHTAISLCLPIFTLAITEAVLRFAIHKDSNKEEIFSTGVKVIVIGFVPLVLVSNITRFFISNTSAISYFLILYILQAFNTLFGAFSKAINKTKQMAGISAFISISLVCFNVYFVAIAQYGITGYWISSIISNVLGFLAYVVICKLYQYWRLARLRKDVIIEMLHYSAPLIPNSLFWWINGSLDKWTLTALAGVSIVGLYSCASKIPSILSTVNTVFSQGWNLSLFQSDDSDERRHFFTRTYWFFNEIIFCCCIGLTWLSKYIATIMFSKDFFQAWIYIPLLAFGVYYNSLNSFIGSLYTAEHKTKDIFTTTLIGSIINLVLNFPFIYIWGAQGAAISTLLSYITVWICRTYRIRKLFNVHLDYRNGVIKFIIMLFVSVCTIYDKLFLYLSLLIVIYYIVELIAFVKMIRVKE